MTRPLADDLPRMLGIEMETMVAADVRVRMQVAGARAAELDVEPAGGQTYTAS